MNKLALKTVREDVGNMLGSLDFDSSEGAYVEGEWVAIEIIPKRRQETALCDLHFRIIPYHLEKDAPAEVLGGVREACLEALSDPNPNVQFAAQHYLDSLQVTERISPGDMEGLIVSLSVRSERGDESKTESTDRDGEIWFSAVSLSGVCSLKMETQPSRGGGWPFATQQSPPMILAAQERAAMALAAKSTDESRPKPKRESRTFYLSDVPVVALLEEVVGGEAVLTLETQAKELRGATVRFQWGKDIGEIKLEPAETGATWSGQCKLTHSFKELAAVVPKFELIRLR
jgi:hypothetical protein